MKKLILFLCVLYSYAGYAQECGKILYSEDACKTHAEDGTQHLSLKLENGSLFITGRIIANCCGSHFLEYEIYSDLISLSRIDEEELCDCYCLFDIDVEIENCPLSSYKVILAEYKGNDGIETMVYSDPSSLNNLKENDIVYYFNPAKSQLIIELSNQKLEKFVLYDTFGKIINKLENIDIDNDMLFIDTEKLMRSIYISAIQSRWECFIEKNNHFIIFHHDKKKYNISPAIFFNNSSDSSTN